MKFRVIYTETETYPIEVEADTAEEARKKADAVILAGGYPYETTGVQFDNIHVVGPADAPILGGAFDRDIVKSYLMDGDELSDKQTIDLWNDLFSDDPDKIVFADLDELLSDNFDTMSELIVCLQDNNSSLDDIDVSDDCFWLDTDTGAIRSGNAGEAVDAKIDFDEMADVLVGSNYYGMDELVKSIKAYAAKKRGEDAGKRSS